MSIFNEFYFKEENSLNILYSGQRTNKPTFDTSKLGKGKDQEGVGFYFTTNKDEAAGYAAPNGIIITAENKLKNVIKNGDHLNVKHAEKLIQMAPDLDNTLANWGYDPPYMSRASALKELKNSVIDEDDIKDTFLQIWYDVYYVAGANGLFVENMKKLGYDGLLIPKANGVFHIVVYNPDNLNIINVEKYIDYAKEDEE